MSGRQLERELFAELNEAAELVATGTAHMRSNDLEDAVLAFSAALSLRGSDVEVKCDALFNRGLAFLAQDRLSQAEQDFAALIQVNAHCDQAVHVLAALCCKRQDKPQRALAYLSRALKSYPFYVDARLARGQLRLQTGQPQDALDDFQVAASCSPALPAGHAALGDAYMALRDGARAVAAYGQALALDPRLHAVRLRRARILRASDPEACAADLETLAVMDSAGLPQTLFERGLLYAEADPPKAVASLRRLVDEAGDGEERPALALAHYHLGLIAFRDGDFDSALSDFHAAKTLLWPATRLVQTEWDGAETVLPLKWHATMCAAARQLRELDSPARVAEALATLDAACDAHPKRSLARAFRGYVHVLRRDYARAAADTAAALPLSRSVPVRGAAVRYNLWMARGMCAAAVRRPKDALAAFKRAAAVCPRRAEPRYRAALARVQALQAGVRFRLQSTLNNALADAGRAVRGAGASPEALLLRAQLLRVVGTEAAHEESAAAASRGLALVDGFGADDWRVRGPPPADPSPDAALRAKAARVLPRRPSTAGSSRRGRGPRARRMSSSSSTASSQPSPEEQPPAEQEGDYQDRLRQQLLVARGLARFRLYAFDEAAADFAAAGDAPFARALRAQCAAATGDVEAALAEARRDARDDDVHSLTRLGALLVRARQDKAAVDAFSKAVDLNAIVAVEAAFQRYRVHLQNGRATQALEDIQLTSRLRPNHVGLGFERECVTALQLMTKGGVTDVENAPFLEAARHLSLAFQQAKVSTLMHKRPRPKTVTAAARPKVEVVGEPEPDLGASGGIAMGRRRRRRHRSGDEEEEEDDGGASGEEQGDDQPEDEPEEDDDEQADRDDQDQQQHKIAGHSYVVGLPVWLRGMQGDLESTRHTLEASMFSRAFLHLARGVCHWYTGATARVLDDLRLAREMAGGGSLGASYLYSVALAHLQAGDLPRARAQLDAALAEPAPASAGVLHFVRGLVHLALDHPNKGQDDMKAAYRCAPAVVDGYLGGQTDLRVEVPAADEPERKLLALPFRRVAIGGVGHIWTRPSLPWPRAAPSHIDVSLLAHDPGLPQALTPRNEELAVEGLRP